MKMLDSITDAHLTLCRRAGALPAHLDVEWTVFVDLNRRVGRAMIHGMGALEAARDAVVEGLDPVPALQVAAEANADLLEAIEEWESY